MDGTVFGPLASASAWKKPGCPLVPKAFRQSDGAFSNTIAQLKNFIKQDKLTVDDLDSEFLTRHAMTELPRTIANTIRSDSQNLEYSPVEPVVPAGVPLEWILELPIPIRACRSISSLIAKRRKMNTQMLGVSVREFMETPGVGFRTVYETLCVIESAEKQSSHTKIEQSETELYDKINKIMFASIANTAGIESSHSQTYSTLLTLASWAKAEQLGQTFSEVIQRIHDQNINSEEWLAFARLTLDGLADETKHPYVVIDEWVNGLSNRDSIIFMSRLKVKPAQKTLAELGLILSLTRERVRQVESKLKSDLKALAKGVDSIRWRCDSLRREIGVASPLHQVEHLLAPPSDYLAFSLQAEDEAFQLPLACSTDRPDFRQILLEMAGPFKLVDNWVVLQSKIKSDPTKSLIASADQFGTIDINICTERLNHWGLDQSLHKSWLTRNEQIHEFNGKLFRKPKSAPDRAVMALIELGQPADVDTIINHAGWNGNRGTMANGLGNDPRLIRVSRDKWGLCDWDMQPYQTIAEAIKNMLEEYGEAIPTTVVINNLHTRFGFLESSISTYFTAPAFVVEDGNIRLRGSDDDPFEYSASALRRNKGVFKLADRRVALLLQVDNDMLRGSGRTLMKAAAEILELRVGESLEFSQRNGPGAKAYFYELSSSGPSLSSLQALVRNLTGKIGDYLVLVLDRNTMTVNPSLVKPSEIVQSWDSVGQLTGISGIGDLQALAASLQCDEDEVYGILQSRGDKAVVRALPTPELS